MHWLCQVCLINGVTPLMLPPTCRWDDLLSCDISKAREALEAWQSQTASEAKLSRALKDGAGSLQLARAIQEAAAAGVKVQAARRVLKLMQMLETATSQVKST